MDETAAGEVPGVNISACLPRGRIELRGDAADLAFSTGVSKVIGTEPPSMPNTSRSGANTVILWLGPDEWLIEIAVAAENEVSKRLEDSLSEVHASVAVVGDASVTLSVSGPRAPDVLAKGMTLDLDPDQFAGCCCARSLLARTPVLLHRPGDSLVYEITVAHSFSDHVARWLRDAALEYGQLP